MADLARSSRIAALGLAATVLITCSALPGTPARHEPPDTAAVAQPSSCGMQFRLLAVGDVNLGRGAGQELLKGDTLYPFASVRDTLSGYDLVFANLECPLSDQDGETQDPENNLVFTGPPTGAESLHRAGVTMVSTANNHALDYGVDALDETMNYLERAGVLYAGTARDTSALYRPARCTVKGIRVALFACTDVMNAPGQKWRRSVAAADTARLLPAIRAIRDSVDFIIVSFHGGVEYANRPTVRTRAFARWVIDAGADLFIGHHPHVPYGIDERHGRMILYSLGNFVFSQPQRYWTRHSFAFSAVVTKDSAATRISRFSCLPVRCGFQPEFESGSEEGQKTLDRIRSLSSEPLSEYHSW